MSLVLIIHRLL